MPRVTRDQTCRTCHFRFQDECRAAPPQAVAIPGVNGVHTRFPEVDDKMFCGVWVARLRNLEHDDRIAGELDVPLSGWVRGFVLGGLVLAGITLVVHLAIVNWPGF